MEKVPLHIIKFQVKKIISFQVKNINQLKTLVANPREQSAVLHISKLTIFTINISKVNLNLTILTDNHNIK